jgi:hypothetical protein
MKIWIVMIDDGVDSVWSTEAKANDRLAKLIVDRIYLLPWVDDFDVDPEGL